MIRRKQLDGLGLNKIKDVDKERKWTKREKDSDAIGHIYNVFSLSGELHYLRILFNDVKGTTLLKICAHLMESYFLHLKMHASTLD
ncbi:hypothetical protein V2J09_000617 [Rumex salicifolius]